MSVVVVGAGPTGLTLACGLLQRGIPVRVLDAADRPATTSRAQVLQPRGAEVLERIGALGDLCERGVKAMDVTVYTDAHPVLRLQVERALRREGRSVVFISQAKVEAQLRRRLAELGGHVEWGSRVVDATVDAEAVAATVDGQQSVRADWLVGCDGAHSVVRELAGVDFPGAPFAGHALLADVHADLPIGRRNPGFYLHRDGVLAVVPLPGEDLWRVIAGVHAEETDVRAQLAAIFAARAGWPKVRIGAVQWTSLFQIQHRVAAQYRRGRILLAGDAAHVHSPVGGQGLNTGIGDAENLAWKLVLVSKGIAAEQLLDSYQAERHPVAEGVVGGTTTATDLLLSSRTGTRLLRDWVVLPALNRPRLQRRLIGKASQLRLSYRGGRLAPRRQVPVGLRIGDRVPDMACSRRDGTATGLYRELAGRWALLTPTGSLPPAVDRLGDEVVVLTVHRSDTLLVRPDGHLAWRGRFPAVRLQKWLAALLDGTAGDGQEQPASPGSLAGHFRAEREAGFTLDGST